MPKKTFQRYGCNWEEGTDAWDIEKYCINKGGKWTDKAGNTCGIGLFNHFKNAQSLFWPTDDHTRWSDLVLRSIVENDVTVLMGPADSAKTYGMVRWALVDWWSDPDNTLHLISSTDVRGLELRVWGKMKELLNRAKDLHEDLPGQVLESMHSITPDKITFGGDRGRLLQRGLITVPCIQGGRYVGMGRFVGVKAKRLRHIGDEISFMGSSFLTAYSNWYGKGDFKGVMAFNPIDPLDPGGKAAEPPEGWSAMPIPTKTTTWRSTFFNAMVVNLVGTDSPNFDYPADEPPRYDYLVGPKKLNAVAKTYGKDSMEWSSQCEGVMRPGLVGKRVITREMCRIHHAHDEAVWAGMKRTRVYGLDPAFGGGDRCVGIWAEFGPGLDGRDILCVYEPEVIPVSVKIDKEPEDQIAEHVKMRLDELEIPYENAGYDSFGGGKLGHAFSLVFGYNPPAAVDSGSRPTKRPVRYDLFVKLDGSPWIGGSDEKRLKVCSEEYSKFVTEMWFSSAEIIKGGQMRQLPQEVMLDGCLREYKTVLGNKTEVETKDKTKERMGKSPDLYDALTICVEMARRKGFKILRLGVAQPDAVTEYSEDNLHDEQQDILQSKLLKRAA